MTIDDIKGTYGKWGLTHNKKGISMEIPFLLCVNPHLPYVPLISSIVIDDLEGFKLKDQLP